MKIQYDKELIPYGSKFNLALKLSELSEEFKKFGFFDDHSHISVCYLGDRPLSENEFLEISETFYGSFNVKITGLTFVGPNSDIPAFVFEILDSLQYLAFENTGEKYGQVEDWMLKEKGINAVDATFEVRNNLFINKGGQMKHITLPPKFKVAKNDDELLDLLMKFVDQKPILKVCGIFSKPLGFGKEPYAKCEL